MITWQGRVVTTLKGREAARFVARSGGLEAGGAQQLMAKMTGNFKRGNERTAASRRRREGEA